MTLFSWTADEFYVTGNEPVTVQHTPRNILLPLGGRYAPSNSTFCLLATVVNIAFLKQRNLQDYTNSGEGIKVGRRGNVFIL